MIEQDFILLIMNCKKYYKKALHQKDTWLKKLPSSLIYYHVVGDKTIKNDFEFDDVEKILWVKTPDDYNSLPKKVISAYNAIHETFNYKYIFKTDDDQVLIKPSFFDIIIKVIKNKNPVSHYGGYVVDVKSAYLSQYHRIHPELPKNLPVYPTTYCNGRFYFLSKEAVISLIYKRETITKEFLEDYAVGYNLDDYYKKDILDIATNKIFVDMVEHDDSLESSK